MLVHNDAAVSKLTLTALLMVLLLGSALRIYGIDNQSFWDDELSSWVQSSVPTLTDVIEEARHDVHPPGHSILLYFVQKFFGVSEFALRLPSTLFQHREHPSYLPCGVYA